MQDNASTVISKAMRKIGKVPANQAVPGYLIDRGLELLNDILDEWGAARIKIPYQSELTLPLVNDKETYLIGNSPSYDLNTDQVIDVLELTIKMGEDANAVYYPTSFMTEAQYATTAYRAAQGTPNQYLLRNNVDYSEIRLQPVPSNFAQPQSAIILCKQRLQRVSQNQDLSQIPNHFILALQMQITLYAQDILGMPMPPEFVQRTQQKLDNLLASNFDIDLTAQVDEILYGGLYDGYYYYGYRF